MVYRVLSSSLSYTLLQNYMKNIVSTITQTSPLAAKKRLLGGIFFVLTLSIYFFSLIFDNTHTILRLPKIMCHRITPYRLDLSSAR